MTTLIVIIIFVICVLLSYQLGYSKAINKIQKKISEYEKIKNKNEVEKIKKNNSIVNDILLMSDNAVNGLLQEIANASNKQ